MANTKITSFISAELLAAELQSNQPPVLIGVETDAPLDPLTQIPGTIAAPIQSIFAGTGGGDLGRLPLPQREQVQAYLRSLGIQANTRVVVYDAGNSAHAARAWWVLNWAGHQAVQILDGGLTAWHNRRTDLVSAESGASAAVFKALETAELDGSVSNYLLVDARGKAMYLGSSPGAQHMPGAINSPVVSWQDDQGRLLPRAQRQAQAEALGLVGSDKPVVAYCGAGVAAAYLIAATSDLGLPVRFYPGSWSAWSANPARLQTAAI